MTTAQTIINDALHEIGVLADGDTATASMADDALRALNRILDLESNNLAFDYSASHETINLTGQSSFTIGPTGNVITSRPIRIDKAQAISGTVTYDVDIINVYEWDSIPIKTLNSFVPEVIYYNGIMTNGTVQVWPQATCTLNMLVVNQVTSFANLSTAVSLPPGYEAWLIPALAVVIAPQYPAGVLNPLTLNAARNALKIIKRTNKLIPELSTDIYGKRGTLIPRKQFA